MEEKPPKCPLCKGKGKIDPPIICPPGTPNRTIRRMIDSVGGKMPCPSCRGSGKDRRWQSPPAP